MRAVLREVRLLDREPKKADESIAQKRVGGYVIVKGIPIPPRHQKRARAIVEALSALEIGESFVHRTRISTEATRGAGKGKKFVQRIVDKGPQYRIWRTE